MREIFTYGSVGGAPGNRCFYLEPDRLSLAVAESRLYFNLFRFSATVCLLNTPAGDQNVMQQKGAQSMDLPFECDDFQGRDLVIRTAGLFKSARLLIDQVEVVGKRGKFSAHDNQGRLHEFKLKTNGLDPVPKVEIDGTTIKLARALTWYEYLWMGLPIALVFAGGGLGALFGLVATYTSARIFRSNRRTAIKYALTGAVSLGAVVVFLLSAGSIQLFMAENRDISSREALEQIAKNANKDLPKMVDDQTELLKLDGLGGVLVYHYRLPKVQPGQINEEELLDLLRPVVTNNACANAELRERFLDNGVALRYIYSDSQGVEIAQFDVTADNCP